MADLPKNGVRILFTLSSKNWSQIVKNGLYAIFSMGQMKRALLLCKNAFPKSVAGRTKKGQSINHVF